MLNMKHMIWFKTICIVLIATFLSLDIAYAHPNDTAPNTQNLSTQSLFQQTFMTQGGALSQKVLFNDIGLSLSVLTIADYLLSGKLKVAEALPYMKEAVTDQFGKKIFNGINLTGVALKDGIALIPYKRDGKKYIIQVAPKNSKAVSLRGAEGDEAIHQPKLIGHDWTISDTYAVRLVPQDYIAEQPVNHGMSSDVTVSVEQVAAESTNKANPPKLFSIEPFSMAGVIVSLGSVISSVVDYLVANPISVVLSVIFMGPVVFIIIWRVFNPVSWHLAHLAGSETDRKKAIKGLIKLGKRATSVLIKNLNSKNPHIRSQAALVLGEIFVFSATKYLIKALSDSDQTVRIAAKQSLIKIGHGDLPEFIVALHNTDDRNIIAEIGHILTMIGEPAKELLQETMLSGDEDKQIKQWALELLCKMDKDFADRIASAKIVPVAPVVVSENPQAVSNGPTSLEDDIIRRVKELEYSDQTAKEFLQMIYGWKDESGQSYINIWKQTYDNLTIQHDKGDLSADQVAEMEVKLLSEIGRVINSKISPNVKSFELSDAIKYGTANCLGYSQIIYILTNFLGFDTDVVFVDMKKFYSLAHEDLGQVAVEHVVDLTKLKNGKIVIIDAVTNFKDITYAVDPSSMFVKIGHRLVMKNQITGELLNHKWIQILGKDGVIAAIYNSRGKKFKDIKQPAEAIEWFSKSILRKPDLVMGYINRADDYLDLGDIDKALSDINTIFKLEPDNSFAFMLRGFIFFKNGLFDKATADFEQAIRISLDDPRIYWQRGALYGGSRLQEALSDLTKAIEIYPNYVDAYMSRADIYNQAGKYDLSIADCSKALEIDPENAFAYAMRGSSYEKINKINEAISDYGKALEYDVSIRAKILANRAGCYVHVGRYNDAISDCEESINISPSVEAFYNRGFAYWHLQQMEKALQDYSMAIEMEPNHAESYNSRGKVYALMSKNDKALSDFNRATELAPNSFQVYYNRGVLFESLGKYAEALSDYNTAIELAPEEHIVYVNRGILLGYLEKYAEAVADFGKVIELNPREMKAYDARIVCNVKAGNIEEAIIDCGRLIALDPSNSSPYYKRGSLYGRTNKLSEAIGDLSMAIKIDPTRYDAYFERGIVLTRMEKFDAAISDLTKAIMLKPDGANAYYNRGVAYLSSSRFQEAISDNGKAIELNPNDAFAYYNCGLANAFLRNTEQARIFILKAVALEPKLTHMAMTDSIRHGLGLRLDDLTRNSITLHSFEPFSILFAASLIGTVIDSISSVISDNPYIIGTVGLGAGVVLFFTAWRIFFVHGYINNLNAKEAPVSYDSRVVPGPQFGGDISPVKTKEEKPVIVSPVADQEATEEAKQLFDIVDHTINNRRAQFVHDANEVIASIKGEAIQKLSLQGVSFNEDMPMSELKENLAKLADITTTAGKLQGDIVKVATDSIIASIIAKSRLVQKGQKLIIGIETDWIPGLNDKTDKGYGSQHDAINPLLREIEDIGIKLKALGLDNVEIIHKSKLDLESAILKRAEDTKTNMSNIIILGSNDIIQVFKDNGTFQKMTSAVTERAFLAGIDPTNIAETYARAKSSGTEIVNVNIIEILSITLALAMGKEPPKTPMIVSYDKQTRVVVFLPKAEPVNYDQMKQTYEAQRAALASL